MRTVRRVSGLMILIWVSFCVLSGAHICRESTRILADTARMASLPSVAAADLPRLAPGVPVLATGTLDGAPAPDHGGLVLAELYRLHGGDHQWVWRRESEQPPQPRFVVRQEEGVLPVLEGRYPLHNPPGQCLLQHHWGGGQQTGDQSYEGFRVGDTVTVVGSVVRVPEGKVLRPEMVDRGTREEALQELRFDGLYSRYYGIVMILVGIGSGIGLVRRWRRLC
jgi:hypothetical protein